MSNRYRLEILETHFKTQIFVIYLYTNILLILCDYKDIKTDNNGLRQSLMGQAG